MQQAGGFAIYRLGTEDAAIWDAINLPRQFPIERDGEVVSSRR